QPNASLFETLVITLVVEDLDTIMTRYSEPFDTNSYKPDPSARIALPDDVRVHGIPDPIPGLEVPPRVMIDPCYT
nr:hypothetical protein [Tanacetum cinerariifolium]